MLEAGRDPACPSWGISGTLSRVGSSRRGTSLKLRFTCLFGPSALLKYQASAGTDEEALMML